MTPDTLYIGTVIYDSDLLNADDTRPLNRVKVFVNGVTPNIRESFKQPRGKNNPTTITPNTLDVVGKSVYAYVMQPIIGSGTSARYNANKDVVSVADVGDINDLQSKPPADNYFMISDNYVGGQNTGSAGVNPTAMAYSPDNRSNAYKGMLSLPSVGSVVVIGYLYGEIGSPIILGYLPGLSDVESLHNVGGNIRPNYPVAYSNLTAQSEKSEEYYLGKGTL
jgi:hypothetical protein